MSMEDFQVAIREFLDSHFSNLQNTRLVTERNTGDDSLAEFVNTLNVSIPTTPHLLAGKSAIRMWYTANRQSATDYMMNIRTKSKQLCLWTDGPTIARVLNIEDLVVIRWDKETEQFAITRRTKRVKQQNRRNKYYAKPRVEHNTDALASNLNETVVNDETWAEPTEHAVEIASGAWADA